MKGRMCGLFFLYAGEPYAGSLRYHLYAGSGKIMALLLRLGECSIYHSVVFMNP